MKSVALALILMAVGCGSSSETSDTQQTTSGVTQAAKAPESVDELKISAKLIASGEPYPICDFSAKGDLIYVLDETLFYFCDENLGWLTVDLNGKNGRDGLNGRDGRDGTLGKEGKAGADGKDAPYIGAQEWIHPITGDKWFLGRLITTSSYVIDDQNPTGDFTEEHFLCPAGSHSPDAEEMKSAYYSGAMTIFLPLVTGLGTGYINAQFIVGLRERSENDGTYYDKTLMGTEGQIQNLWNVGGYPICVVGQ